MEEKQGRGERERISVILFYFDIFKVANLGGYEGNFILNL